MRWASFSSVSSWIAKARIRESTSTIALNLFRFTAIFAFCGRTQSMAAVSKDCLHYLPACLWPQYLVFTMLIPGGGPSPVDQVAVSLQAMQPHRRGGDGWGARQTVSHEFSLLNCFDICGCQMKPFSTCFV
jgi:hypothetical protein